MFELLLLTLHLKKSSRRQQLVHRRQQSCAMSKQAFTPLACCLVIACGGTASALRGQESVSTER